MQKIGRVKIPVEVITNQGPIQCRTYQFKDPNAKFGRPSPQYKTVIVSGAKEHDLPEEYLKKLENLEVCKFFFENFREFQNNVQIFK